MWTDTSGEGCLQNFLQCLARQSVICTPPCLLSLAPTKGKSAGALFTFISLTDPEHTMPPESWVGTAGILETQGSDGTFYDAPEGQEQVPHEQRTAASEASPVCQVISPAPPSTPVVSPALSAAKIAPETPTKPRSIMLNYPPVPPRLPEGPVQQNVQVLQGANTSQECYR